MNRADRFEFTLDEDTEKRLYELLTDMDTRNTDRFWIKDKRGYHAEYVKVRHGKWLCSDDMYETAVCSVCNYDTEEPYECGKKSWNFCPNCGAKMDGERKEE